MNKILENQLSFYPFFHFYLLLDLPSFTRSAWGVTRFWFHAAL